MNLIDKKSLVDIVLRRGRITNILDVKATSTVLARPIRPLKHPVNSALAGGMTDDRRTGRGRTVVPYLLTLSSHS